MSPQNGDLASLIRTLRSTSDGTSFREWAANRLVEVAGEAHDPAGLREAVSTVLEEVDGCREILRRLLQEFHGPEGGDPKERYTEAWWTRKEGLIQWFATESDPESGWALWLRTYALALLDGQIPAIERLAGIPLHLPNEEASKGSSVEVAVRTIQKEGTQSAIFHLLQATIGEPPEPVLDERTRASLLLLQGRVHLYQVGEPEVAIGLFLQADGLTPEDGGPEAAMGDYFRTLGDSAPSPAALKYLQTCGGPSEGDTPLRRNRAAARFLYERAVTLSPELSAGWVGRGRLLEEDELWDEADDQYAQAIRLAREGGGIGSLEALLDSVGGGLHLQRARMLRREGDQVGALDAVDRALGKSPVPFLSRIGHRLRAEALDVLNRPEEAAESYYQAGVEFLRAGDHRVAIDLLRRAQERSPGHLSTYWNLSDALRIASYRPPPENVDERVLAESSEVWYQGATRHLPDREDAWAWAVLAGIHEQRARLPGSDSWAQGWASALCLERALALRPRDPDRLNGIGRAYRMLRLPTAALHAFDVALEIWPRHPLVLDEKIITLINNVYLDEAMVTIDERAAVDALDDWHRAAQAFVLARQGALDDALEMIHSTIEGMDEGVPWMVELRGLCHHRLGHREEAEADYRRLWDAYDPRDRDNQILYGWAAYRLGDHDSALKIFESVKDRRLEAPLAHRNLGLCHLKRGKLVQAREAFNGALPGCNRLELRDLVTFELPEVEGEMEETAAGPETRAFIAELRAKIELRQVELDAPLVPEEELGAVLDALEAEGGTGTPPWIAVQAGLARLHLTADRWGEAAPIYRRLLEEYPAQFPEGIHALEAGVEQIQARAEAELAGGDPDSGAHLLSEALELVRGLSLEEMEERLQLRIGELLMLAGKEEEAVHRFQAALANSSAEAKPRRSAGLHARVGVSALLAGAPALSLHHRREARRLYETAGVEEPAREVMEVCRNLLRGPADYWVLATELELEGVKVDESGLDGVLDDFFRLSESTEFAPVVTPISVELAANLVPEYTGPEWALLRDHVPQMRGRILEELGVALPGINFRANQGDLPGGTYLIMLEEVPLVLGTLYPHMSYADVPPESLEGFGVPPEETHPAPHPVTAAPGSWIPPEFGEAVANRGVPVWTDPLLYMVHHVEAILRSNLGDFLGLHEVQRLLDQWSEEDGGAQWVEEALPSADDRLRFARLLRALVREGVPITAWQEILGTWIRDELGSAAPDDALRTVRMGLRGQLPGNHPPLGMVELPEDAEERTIPWLQSQNGRWFLAAPPEEVQEFLGILRETFAAPSDDRGGETGTGRVLVVRRPELRAPLRRLTELEFPHVYLLSREEVVSTDETTEFHSSEALELSADGIAPPDQIAGGPSHG